MDAWVYLFSKFTHEALLFEALALFLGLFGYAVFYLIRKRKYGVAGKEVPSNVMKVYLAQLVGDAEEIRTQLFGLLGKGEASARLMANLQFQADLPAVPTAGAGATLAGAPVATTQLVQDPKLTEKLKELESKLSEQATALDSVLNEKMKLEEELASAKTGGGSADEGSEDAKAGEKDRTGPLQERVKQLEAQLAEYAIIEDDLANLKRLQKENKTLKQQLADGGGAPTAAPADAPSNGPEFTPAANAAKPAAAPADAPATPEEPEVAPKSAHPVAPDLSGPTDSDIATEAVDPTHPTDPDQPADFESLVDVVEKNLADSTKSENVDLDAAASETKPDEKSEEQLQADFEKMLKS
jgi:hypothetical protein